MLNFSSILIFSEKPSVLVEFYKKVLQQEADWSSGDFTGFQVGTGFISIGPHDKVHGPNSIPERLMFNLESEDFDTEYNRIKELGVKIVSEPYNPGEEKSIKIATFADPDGNYFQLVTPWKA